MDEGKDSDDENQYSTVKRNLPKFTTQELLHLLASYEGEVDAQHIILTYFLKSSQNGSVKHLRDPYQVLKSDKSLAARVPPETCKVEEAEAKSVYNRQLVQLENLISIQQKAQQKQRTHYQALEQHYRKICEEVEHLRYEAKTQKSSGTENVVALKNEIQTLKSQLDAERSTRMRLEDQLQEAAVSLAEERSLLHRQNHVTQMLVRERGELEAVLEALNHQRQQGEEERNQLRARLVTAEAGMSRMVAEVEALRTATSRTRMCESLVSSSPSNSPCHPTSHRQSLTTSLVLQPPSPTPPLALPPPNVGLPSNSPVPSISPCPSSTSPLRRKLPHQPSSVCPQLPGSGKSSPHSASTRLSAGEVNGSSLRHSTGSSSPLSCVTAQLSPRSPPNVASSLTGPTFKIAPGNSTPQGKPSLSSGTLNSSPDHMQTSHQTSPDSLSPINPASSDSKPSQSRLGSICSVPPLKSPQSAPSPPSKLVQTSSLPSFNASKTPGLTISSSPTSNGHSQEDTSHLQTRLSPPSIASAEAEIAHLYQSALVNGHVKSQKVCVYLEWVSLIPSEGPPVLCHPSRILIGHVGISASADWCSLEEDVISSFLSWIELLDQAAQPLETEDTGTNDSALVGGALGIGSESVARFQLNSVKWVPGCTDDLQSRPFYHLSTAPSSDSITVHLANHISGHLDSVAMQTLIPVQAWASYLNLLRNNKCAVFYGRPFTCKTYIISILAKLYESLLSTNYEAIATIKTHWYDPTAELTFDFHTWLLKRGIIQPENKSNGVSSPLYHHILVLDNMQCIYNQPILTQLIEQLQFTGSRKSLQLLYHDMQSYILTGHITMMGSFFSSHSPPPLLNSSSAPHFIHLRGDDSPLAGLVPRCVFRATNHNAPATPTGSQSEEIRILQWVSDVWIRLVNSLTRLGMQEALVGPGTFLSCPALFETNSKPGRQAIINWLVAAWNACIVPNLRHCLSDQSNDALPSSPVSPTNNNNNIVGGTGRCKVADTATFVLVQQVVLTGCPLSSLEREKLVQQLDGGSSLKLPWKRKTHSMESFDTETSTLSSVTTSRSASRLIPNSSSPSRTRIPVRVQSTTSPPEPVHQSTERRTLPTLPSTSSAPGTKLIMTRSASAHNGHEEIIS